MLHWTAWSASRHSSDTWLSSRKGSSCVRQTTQVSPATPAASPADTLFRPIFIVKYNSENMILSGILLPERRLELGLRRQRHQVVRLLQVAAHLHRLEVRLVAVLLQQEVRHHQRQEVRQVVRHHQHQVVRHHQHQVVRHLLLQVVQHLHLQLVVRHLQLVVRHLQLVVRHPYRWSSRWPTTSTSGWWPATSSARWSSRSTTASSSWWPATPSLAIAICGALHVNYFEIPVSLVEVNQAIIA